MNKNNNIQETINQILLELKKSGMTESSIKIRLFGHYGDEQLFETPEVHPIYSILESF